MSINTSGLPSYTNQDTTKLISKTIGVWQRRRRRIFLEEGCPPTTQDVGLNLKNRQKAIDTAMYGPLDIKNPGDYWKKIAENWGVDEKTARGETCGNCSAFNITSNMLKCIAEGIGTEPSSDPWDVIEAGDLGYCEIFKFKCNGNRSCSAHIDGGPLTD